jgi:hypothetical protein
MEHTYDKGYVATSDFEYLDETFKAGEAVPDDVVADMWAESGGSSNSRFRIPVRR